MLPPDVERCHGHSIMVAHTRAERRFVAPCRDCLRRTSPGGQEQQPVIRQTNAWRRKASKASKAGAAIECAQRISAADRY